MMDNNITEGGATVKLLVGTIGLLVTIMLTVFGWVMTRLRSLESRQAQTPTRSEVRDTIAAATGPIREDVKDVKATGQKTYELLVRYITGQKL